MVEADIAFLLNMILGKWKYVFVTWDVKNIPENSFILWEHYGINDDYFYYFVVHCIVCVCSCEISGFNEDRPDLCLHL